MALSVGSVDIEEDGSHSGSGCVYEMLDAWWTAKSAEYATASADTIVAVKEGIVSLLEAIATGLISELTSNAEVSVEVSEGGLQTIPFGADYGDPTAAPASAVTLTGTLS